MPPLLQGPWLSAGSLHLNEADPATRQQDQPVRHTIKAGTYKFRCDPSDVLSRHDELVLYCFFSHKGYLHQKCGW